MKKFKIFFITSAVFARSPQSNWMKKAMKIVTIPLPMSPFFKNGYKVEIVHLAVTAKPADEPALEPIIFCTIDELQAKISQLTQDEEGEVDFGALFGIDLDMYQTGGDIEPVFFQIADKVGWKRCGWFPVSAVESLEGVSLCEKYAYIGNYAGKYRGGVQHASEDAINEYIAGSDKFSTPVNGWLRSMA